MNKNTLLIVALLILLGGGVALSMKGQNQNSTIDSFDECVEAGYPVMESYPAKCATPDGQTFTQIIDEPIAESWGSIYGIVMFGPVCPGPIYEDQSDSKCDDKPYAGAFALTTADGTRVVKEFSSDSNGKFTVDVAPGTYAIRFAGENTLPQCGTNDPIVVRANDSTEVTVSCDSGIR